MLCLLSRDSFCETCFIDYDAYFNAFWGNVWALLSFYFDAFEGRLFEVSFAFNFCD